MTASTDTEPIAVQPPARAVHRARFFDDVAGLRGIAALLVVMFHANVPYFNGGFVGVDLFFVISGFLITGLLIREYEHKGTISFRGFYARRARRIIPPAALVIVTSIVVASFVMPLLKVFKQSLDLLAAAANLANWHFIAQNADYLAGAIDGSMAAHFWSLSIEEQLYFIWPLCIFLAAVLVMRTPLRRLVPMRVMVGIVVGIISAISLVLAIRLTPTDPGLAYMATYTRVWQFGAGGLIAVATPLIYRWTGRSALAMAFLLGWSGVAALIIATVSIDTTTPYPGTAALLPTLGGVAIITGGQLAGTRPPLIGWVLATPPMRFLGRVSYAWYLWHWPAIVLYTAQTGNRSWQALLVVSLVALVIAWFSTMLFEEPLLRNAELRRNASASIAVGITGIVLALTATMVAGVWSVKEASKDTIASASLTYEEVFGTTQQVTSGPVTPNPFQAYDDRPEPNECLVPVGEVTPTRSCEFGQENGTPVVVFGDSHAEQWSEALRDIGSSHGWRIHQFTKAACPAQNLPKLRGVGDPFTKSDCAQWRRDSLAAIAEVKPKIIIFSSLSTYVRDYDISKEAWDDTLAALRATGAKLVYIADTPYPGFQVADCMSGALDDWTACQFELDGTPRVEPILSEQAKGADDDILVLDVNDTLCTGNTCLPARSKILLYRDESHLTNTAATVLQPALVQQLDKARFDYDGR